jgi:hypothetical protein
LFTQEKLKALPHSPLMNCMPGEPGREKKAQNNKEWVLRA